MNRSPGPTDRWGGEAGRRDPPVDAVTLDLWYTLVYLSPAEQRHVAQQRRAAWLRPLLRVGRSRVAALKTLSEMEAWGRTQESRGRAPSLEDHADWLTRHGRLRRPLSDIVEDVDRAMRSVDLRVAPGALRALAALHDHGVPLGLVSTVMFESGTTTRGWLERLGLARVLDRVVLSCEGTVSKPRAEPFRVCLKGLNVRPDRSLHIGDQRFDVDGARAAGMRPVLYTGLSRYAPKPRAGRPGSSARVVPILSRWAGLDTLLSNQVWP